MSLRRSIFLIYFTYLYLFLLGVCSQFIANSKVLGIDAQYIQPRDSGDVQKGLLVNSAKGSQRFSLDADSTKHSRHASRSADHATRSERAPLRNELTGHQRVDSYTDNKLSVTLSESKAKDETEALREAKVTSAGIQIRPAASRTDYSQWLNRIMKLSLHDFNVAQRRYNNELLSALPNRASKAARNVYHDYRTHMATFQPEIRLKEVMRENDALRREIYDRYQKAVQDATRATASSSSGLLSSGVEGKEGSFNGAGGSHQGGGVEDGPVEEGTSADAKGEKKTKKKKKKKKQGKE